MSEPKLLFIDLFCGAGGVTTGIEHARCFDKKVGKVIACVNHDANAIASHQENHPDCLHFTEDIRTLDLTALATIARHARKMFPNAKLCLWASLECTNFSKAKGGLPRDADSRTLAEHLFRYLDVIDFDSIWIENVEEFMSWGPLDAKGKPVSKHRGKDYIKWVDNMKSYGYEFEHRILNAANYGAHTSRKRYFGCFVRPGMQIVFPEPTHNKKGDQGLQKWRPVKEVLDFSDEGESIFTRKKPLSERTMERIYAGLLKYVAKGDTSYLQKYYSGRPKGKVNSTNEPCPTVTTTGGITLVQPVSLLKYNSTNGKTGKYVPPDLEQPCPTISTQGRLGLVNANFIAYYYGQHTLSSVEQPCGTLRTKDTGQVIQPQFGEWLLSPHFNNKGTSIDEPAPTITANRKHHCLMFPQWGLHCTHSIDKPSPVLPARMDKMYPYMIQADESGVPIAVMVFDDDSEAVKKIKTFMAAYGIVDIKMRMLRIKELKKITGFSEDYVLKGTQQDQKKYIGNAVPVLLAQAIIESFANSIIEPLKKAA